jgi:sigma-B regulation protein RsbU (phosphoserine phosphatase)
LAVLDHPTLAECEATLLPGQWLVLYTDGVTDAYSEQLGKAFGEDGLKKVVRNSTDGDAIAMLHGVFKAVTDFVGETPQFDDQTVLVLRRCRVPAD